MLRVPMKLKYQQGQTKYLLKKAAEGIVPHDVIYRKKVGFSVPVTHWFKKGDYFQTHLQDMVQTKTGWHDLLRKKEMVKLIETNRQGAVDYSYQLWALQNLLAFE